MTGHPERCKLIQDNYSQLSPWLSVLLRRLPKHQKKPEKTRFFGLVDLFNYISIKLIIFIWLITSSKHSDKGRLATMWSEPHQPCYWSSEQQQFDKSVWPPVAERLA